MSNPLFKKLLPLAAVVLLLPSCRQESAPPEPPLTRAVIKPVVAAPGADKTDGVADTAVEVKLRNPFLSYMIVRQGSKEGSVLIKGPLECCEIALFRIQAIMTAGKNPKAMISAPDSKRYMVGIGDTLGIQGGKIIKINEKGITIREYTKDAEGKVIITNDVEIKLHADSTQARP